jgi:hypothetical protein
MAYTLSVSIALGSSRTGLTLRAQLIDTAGDDSGSEISSGFIEIGNGFYLWTYSGFPEDFRGGCKVYSAADSSTILTFFAINPEEAEYIDQPVSDIETNLETNSNITIGQSESNVSITTGVRS